MLLALEIALTVAAIVATYAFWLRPILRERPSLMYFYNLSGCFWRGVRLKLQGLKGQLTAALVMAASLFVSVYDAIMPIAAGIDWSPLTQKIPGWVWPIILFAVAFLLDRFRKLAEHRND